MFATSISFIFNITLIFAFRCRSLFAGNLILGLVLRHVFYFLAFRVQVIYAMPIANCRVGLITC